MTRFRATPVDDTDTHRNEFHRNDTHCNEVHLVGRLSGEPESRQLPSGDTIVSFRLVVQRPPHRPAPRQRTGEKPARAGQQVDTIDVVCRTARSQRSLLAAVPGATLEVSGALHRRFFATPAGRQSRYEVDASLVRKVKVERRVAT